MSKTNQWRALRIKIGRLWESSQTPESLALEWRVSLARGWAPRRGSVD